MKISEKLKLKSPVAKTIVIFILLVLIPSAVLIAFGFISLKRELDSQLVLQKSRYEAVSDSVEKEIDSVMQKIEFRLKEECLMNRFKIWQIENIWERLSDLKQFNFIKTVVLFDKNKNIYYPFEITNDHESVRYEIIKNWNKFYEQLDYFDKNLAETRNYNNAVSEYNNMLLSFKEKEQQAVIYSRIADIYRKQTSNARNYSRAFEYYEKITQEYSFYRDINGDSIGANAYLSLATMYLRDLSNFKKSQNYLQDLYEMIKTNKWGLSKDEIEKTAGKIRIMLNSIGSRTIDEIGKKEIRAFTEKIDKETKKRLYDMNEFGKNISNVIRKNEFDVKNDIFGYLPLSKKGKKQIYYYYPVENPVIGTAGFLMVELDYPKFIEYLSKKLNDIAKSSTSTIRIFDDENNLVLRAPDPGNNPNAIVITGSKKYSKLINFEYFYNFESIIDFLLPLKRMDIQPENISAIEKSIINKIVTYLATVIFLIAAMILGVFFTIKGVVKELDVARLKSDFVSNVSHELKTPLAIISLIAEKLQLGRIKSQNDAKEYYDIISVESKRLRRLIENVLDYSRIEEGRKKFNFHEENIVDIIKEVVNSFQYHANQNGFSVKSEIHKEKIISSVDRGAIEQAVYNLLDNAMKYSKDKKEISIAVKEEDKSAKIEVVDFGIGISKKEISRIFEKFYRIGDELTREVKGAGLGLSIVKYIALSHNGDILVESEEGKGSKFSLILPLKN